MNGVLQECHTDDKETIQNAIKTLTEILNASYSDGWKEVIIQANLRVQESLELEIRELTYDGNSIVVNEIVREATVKERTLMIVKESLLPLQ